MLRLCCLEQTFSSCGELGLLFVVMYRLLVVVASLLAEQSLGTGASVAWLAGIAWLLGPGLSSCGIQALFSCPQHVESSQTRCRTCVPCHW